MAAAPSPIPASAEADAGHSLRHIPELDGIRGLAALVVFGHHAFTTTARETLQGGWPVGIRTLSRVFEYGATGVDLFFVLSGYLITSILIANKKSTRFYQEFYWKRALPHPSSVRGDPNDCLDLPASDRLYPDGGRVRSELCGPTAYEHR